MKSIQLNANKCFVKTAIITKSKIELDYLKNNIQLKISI